MVNDKIQSLFRGSLIVLTALGSLVACGSDVVVGDPEEGDDGGGEDGDCPGCGEEIVPSTDGMCVLADEAKVRNYNDWSTAPNDIGAMRDTEWEGTIEGLGATRLFISNTQETSLLVGESFGEPEADKGYPVGVNGFVDLRRPALAGEYPIHGATLEEGELRLVLEVYSPYDVWCALQTPADRTECRFATVSNISFGIDENGSCTLGGEDVDCGWLYMTAYDVYSYCDCTSERCFANIESGRPPSDDPEASTNTVERIGIVLNYDSSAGTLEGFTEDGLAVSLERVD